MTLEGKSVAILIAPRGTEEQNSRSPSKLSRTLVAK